MLCSLKARAEQKKQKKCIRFHKMKILDGERSFKMFFLFLIRWTGVCKLLLEILSELFVPSTANLFKTQLLKIEFRAFCFSVSFYGTFSLNDVTRATLNKKVYNLPLFYEIFSTTNKYGSCFIFIIFPDWFLMKGEISKYHRAQFSSPTFWRFKWHHLRKLSSSHFKQSGENSCEYYTEYVIMPSSIHMYTDTFTYKLQWI